MAGLVNGFSRQPQRLCPVDAGERYQLLRWLLYPPEAQEVNNSINIKEAMKNKCRLCLNQKVFVGFFCIISISIKVLKQPFPLAFLHVFPKLMQKKQNSG